MLARRCLSSIMFAFLFLSPHRSLIAQTQSTAPLPDAPGRGDLCPTTPDPHATASLSGLVLDIHQAIVSGAIVTLSSANGLRHCAATSESEGRFLFSNLAPGAYHVTITSPGLESFLSPDLTLHAGQHRDLPHIALPIAPNTADITVFVTQKEIAAEQLKVQTTQRVFGIVPNFYTSFVWNAAPLTAAQKLHLSLRSTTDPVSFVITGAAAGVQQALNSYPEYGQGAQGYAKRYGAAYADGFIGRTLGGALFPILLHQDPRYFYRGSGTIRQRAIYAITRAVITRGDNGRWQPAYSRIAGNLATGAISNTYHPGDRGVATTFGVAFLGLAGNAFDNLVREFILDDLTTHVPTSGRGKQPAPSK